MRIERCITLLLIFGALGCAEGPPVIPPGPVKLTLRYMGTSDERPLEAALLHSQRDNYRGAPNLLLQPLGRGEEVSFDDIPRGDYYLTVIRLKLPPPITDKLALTTAEPFALQGGHVVIWIFDESFRVFDAVPFDGGVPDLGLPDLVTDAGVEGGLDAADDAPAETSPDAPMETSTETYPDAPREAGSETSADGPLPDAMSDLSSVD